MIIDISMPLPLLILLIIGVTMFVNWLCDRRYDRMNCEDDS